MRGFWNLWWRDGLAWEVFEGEVYDWKEECVLIVIVAERRV